MVPVGRGVDGVVYEVGARCGYTEDPEGGDAVPEHGPVEEHAGGAGRHEDQQVLDPLAGTAQPDQSGYEGRRRAVGLARGVFVVSFHSFSRGGQGALWEVESGRGRRMEVTMGPPE